GRASSTRRSPSSRGERRRSCGKASPWPRDRSIRVPRWTGFTRFWPYWERVEESAREVAPPPGNRLRRPGASGGEEGRRHVHRDGGHGAGGHAQYEESG